MADSKEETKQYDQEMLSAANTLIQLANQPNELPKDTESVASCDTSTSEFDEMVEAANILVQIREAANIMVQMGGYSFGLEFLGVQTRPSVSVRRN